MIWDKNLKSLWAKVFGALLPNGVSWLIWKTHAVVAIPCTEGALVTEKGD